MDYLAELGKICLKSRQNWSSYNKIEKTDMAKECIKLYRKMSFKKQAIARRFLIDSPDLWHEFTHIIS